MDLFLATAYAAVAAYFGFVIGVLARGRYIDRRPPDGGEPPPPMPPDAGPEDWAQWERELTGTTVS